MKTKALWMVALLCLFSLMPAAAQADQAKWTIIYYMALDNDLEPFAINDLMEMQAVGSTDEVNIIVQFDRAEGYESTFGDWTDARRFRIEPASGTTSSGDFAVSGDAMADYYGALNPDDFGMTQEEFDAQVAALRDAPQEALDGLALQSIVQVADGLPSIPLQQESIESVGEINSGDPQYLVDFALWTIENYPADHYGLFISNHGGGWPALANDESADHDALTLPEIDQALAEITSASGVTQFDFIAFDACLEAQLEVMKTIAPYALYSIASEQTIPGAGYNYVRPLTALVNNPDITAVDFGIAAVDGYADFYGSLGVPAWNSYDLGVIDLSQIDNVIAALDLFSEAVQANTEALLPAVSDARNNAQFFGGETPDEADGISSIDLIDFMQYIVKLSPDDAAAQAAQGVIDATSQAVVYHQNSNELPGANGLTIYFPRNGNIFNAYGAQYPSEVSTSMAGWQNFLSAFYGTASTVVNAADLSINITGVLPSEGQSSIYDPPVVLFEMSGQEIVDVSFIVLLQFDQDASIMLDQSTLVSSEVTADGQSFEDYPDGTSNWEFTWNVEMPIVTDGENTVSTVLLGDTGQTDSGVVRVSGIYQPGDGGDPRTAYMVFDTETELFSALWLVSEGSTSPFTIQPRPGDTFEPTYRFVNAEGAIEFIQSGVFLNLNAPEIRYDYVPAETGEYTMILRIEDVAGNVSMTSASMSIDNTDLDPAYRGFKDIGFGVNFLFPWDWTDPTVQLDENEGITLIMSDPDGDITIYVEAYGVTSAEEVLDIKLAAFTENLEDFAYDEPQEIDISGHPGYIVYYSYTSEGQTVLGAFAVVYVEENGYGYSLDLDSSADKVDEANLVFESMLNSLLFFTPVEQ